MIFDNPNPRNFQSLRVLRSYTFLFLFGTDRTETFRCVIFNSYPAKSICHVLIVWMVAFSTRCFQYFPKTANFHECPLANIQPLHQNAFECIVLVQKHVCMCGLGNGIIHILLRYCDFKKWKRPYSGISANNNWVEWRWGGGGGGGEVESKKGRKEGHILAWEGQSLKCVST